MIERMKVTCTIIPSNWLSALTVKSPSSFVFYIMIFLAYILFTFSSQFLRWVEFQNPGRKKKKFGI